MSACKHKVSGTISLPSRGSFHLSLTVLYAIGHWVVFRLGGWSPRIPTAIPRVPWYSGYALHTSSFAYEALTLYGLLSQVIRLDYVHVMHVRTPRILLLLVWPLPRSLATTSGISVDFFSSPYLDVSVQAVPYIRLFYSPYVN